MKELDNGQRMMRLFVPEKTLKVLQKMGELRGQEVDGVKHTQTESLQAELGDIRWRN